MPDMETVKERLGYLVDFSKEKNLYTVAEIAQDSLALLKEQNGLMLALEQSNAVNEYLNAEVERLNRLLNEQEAVEPELEGGGSSWWHVCGECHGMIDKYDNFCRHCGRRVKRT